MILKNLIINRTSFNALEKKFREVTHKEIQHRFNLNDCQQLVLHWDEKRLLALKGIEKVDRLAIIVTFQGKEQSLRVPENSRRTASHGCLPSSGEVRYNRQNSGTLL